MNHKDSWAISWMPMKPGFGPILCLNTDILGASTLWMGQCAAEKQDDEHISRDSDSVLFFWNDRGNDLVPTGFLCLLHG